MILMNGKDLKNIKILELKDKVNELNVKLGLAVIQVGNDEASNVYIKQKEKSALDLDYKYIHKHFNADISEEELIKEIDLLNNDDTIDGILVQMPLPEHFNVSKIQNAISPLKDVDGLTYINTGKLVQNMECLIPCTPKGIIDLLDYYNINLEGANVVVIGRSILVGKPIATLLTNKNATVVLTHSKTNNLSKILSCADIIIAAVGKPGFVTSDMVKEGSVVIDVGINRIDGCLLGDVDFNNVKDKCSHITPVPGGVGPMTVYELMNNVYEAHILREKAGK